MKQAIAGVAPPELREVPVMTTWRSVASTGFGRLLGRLFNIQVGIGALTIGRLLTLLAIPLGPLLYFTVRFPTGNIRRYQLTNRRVAILKGIRGRVERYVDLDRFDTIEVVVRPGQEWYKAGDLVFRKGAMETFRLAGVSRPETFRQTCLKARMSYVGVKKALASELAAV